MVKATLNGQTLAESYETVFVCAFGGLRVLRTGRATDELPQTTISCPFRLTS